MWFLVICVLSAAVNCCTSCPDECRCSLDERGRRRVLCEQGGMRGSIPVMKMNTDTEVLVIIGPPDRPNSLSLGPIFKDMRKLEEIHITWSGIPALGVHSFWGLQHLKNLNLTHNALTALMDTNFRGTDSLRHLDVSYNLIKSVPSAVFRHVRHMKTLHLNNNVISVLVPRMFFGLTRLEKLDLSNNPLSELEAERFTDIPELRYFACTGCGLRSISNRLTDSLPELKELDLRNNRLTSIPESLSRLEHLNKLYLDGNHISVIEEAALFGSTLSRLHLSHNHISRVENGAFRNTSILHLDVSYNRLSKLSEGALYDIFPHIADLQLSGNSLQLNQLSFVLPYAKHLHNLGMGNMGLVELDPDLFKHAYHLRRLNFSSNFLTYFPPEILFLTPNLVSLDLSANNFQGLSSELVAAISASSKLRILHLDGNPWLCDQCHIGPLLQWLHDAPDQESGCSDSRVWTCLKCAGPRGVTDLTLSLIPPGDIPKCIVTTPAWPTWIAPSFNVVTDVLESRRGSQAGEPQLPHVQSTQEKENFVSRLLKEQMLMLVVVGCSSAILILVGVLIVIAVYNRHSAYYYTKEKDVEKRTRVLSPKDHKNSNDHSVVSPTQNGSQDISIATIDEMTDIAGSQELIEDKPEIIKDLESEPRPGSP